MKLKADKRLTFEDKEKKLEEFLRTYEDYDMAETDQVYHCYGRRKYMIQIQKVANGQSKLIQIAIQDLQSFFRKQDQKQLLKDFKTNTQRNTKILKNLIHKLLPPRNLPTTPEQQLKQKFDNLLTVQRRHNISQQEGNVNLMDRPDNQRLPNQLLCALEVCVVYGGAGKVHVGCVGDLGADQIGALVVCKAIVIRASHIRPMVEVATYACDICGCENYQQVGDRQYQPLTRCMSKKCIQNKVSGKLTFLPGHSSFKQYQQLKVQQTPDQLNIGKIPKTFIIHAHGQNCKKAAPGDIIMVQGVLLPIRREGRRDNCSLSFGMYLEAYKITREKKKYVEMNLSQEQVGKIQAVRASLSDEELFKKMARSIAPEIYGLEVVKKALLLMMVGGITKTTEDNLRIRGQINIALIGDPGIAKSQLLKHIAQVAPRGVYTSGKGSSGVGLTAAVTVDPQTRELYLEAGALVLADMGVCCIDEFDKMSEYDRTAIHEVMQQQTVSIAKAGITTSLNARASILAAANPLYGRYNRKESAHKNINLPAALLSRFDLIFILLDQVDPSQDRQLALHIGKVHQNSRAPQSQPLFQSTFLRHYIAISKKFQPTISEELHNEMIHRYIEKRQEQMNAAKEGDSYTTMRSLLALIRLCQARAKLRFSGEVSRADLMDCLEIVDQSQRIANDKGESSRNDSDVSGSIFALIKSMCMMNQKTMSVELSVIEKRVQSKGFSLDDLQRALDEYQKLNVLMVNNGWATLIL